MKPKHDEQEPNQMDRNEARNEVNRNMREFKWN